MFIHGGKVRASFPSANALGDFVKECFGYGIQVIFAGTQVQPMELLTAMGLGAESAQLRHVPSYDQAITLARDLIARADTRATPQPIAI
jgi:hypothetical protein